MSDNNNILNNIDRTQTWVDVETVAKLKVNDVMNRDYIEITE